MSPSRKALVVVAIAIIVGALLLAVRPSVSTAVRPSVSTAVRPDVAPSPVTARPPALPQPTTKVEPGLLGGDTPTAPSPTEAAPAFVRAELPPMGARARRRPWVKATYGADEGQLGQGFLGGGGELFAPQGFVATRDGKLLVLDSNKMRLVRYDAAGRIEHVVPLQGLAMPTDVAVATDGTIAVVDRAGVQTKGILLLNPDGTRKAELPQIQTGSMTGFYAVRNDFFIENDALTSVKAADSSGSASDASPGIYDDEDTGIIPGHVAPDGRTVISGGIDDFERGEFFVSAIRGEPPEHLWSRFYRAPNALWGMPYVQSDGAGRIYAVLTESARTFLLCIDGKTGDPVGMVEMPRSGGAKAGTGFHQYSVVESGGLVYQHISEDSSTYEWFNCH